MYVIFIQNLSQVKNFKNFERKINHFILNNKKRINIDHEFFNDN